MKNAILIGLITFLSCGSKIQPTQLVKTEHGWKGKYLTATRMKNSMCGFDIDFEENKFMGLIDRIEISDIIAKNNGQVLEGDASGLRVVVFNGMNSKAKEDSVILSVLPQLEKWYSKNN